MYSVLGTAALIDVGLQVLGFGISSVLKTEKFYDMFGSITFIAIAIASLFTSGSALTAKQLVLSALVMLWALRLGTFLVVRVFKTGGDKRFDGVKVNPLKFSVYWTIQAIWIYATLLPFLFVMNATLSPSDPFVWVDSIGLFVYAAGLAIEWIADIQKFKFKMDETNEGKFITTGLWKYSRHPNYFGEMMLWWGIWMICVPDLRGAQHLAALSPITVTALISFLSGIPPLERAAEHKWGNQPDYAEWKERVPVLIPFVHTRGLEYKRKNIQMGGPTEGEEAQAGASTPPDLEEPFV